MYISWIRLNGILEVRQSPVIQPLSFIAAVYVGMVHCWITADRCDASFYSYGHIYLRDLLILFKCISYAVCEPHLLHLFHTDWNVIHIVLPLIAVLSTHDGVRSALHRWEPKMMGQVAGFRGRSRLTHVLQSPMAAGGDLEWPCHLSNSHSALTAGPASLLMSYFVPDIFAILLALVCLRLFQSWREHSRSASLPPGPKGLPLIGNVSELQDPETWELAGKWGKKYGDFRPT